MLSDTEFKVEFPANTLLAPPQQFPFRNIPITLFYAPPAIPFSVSFWALDVWGLRPCLLLACWFNCLGAGLRALAALDVLRRISTFNASFYAAIVGQVVGETPSRAKVVSQLALQ